MSIEKGTQEQAPSPEVWLVRETDHFRAGQHLVAIVRDGETTLFEHAGWKAVSPVDAVLALAGFLGGATATLAASSVPAAHVHVEKLRGFPVDEAKLPVVEMEIRKVLGAMSGGFAPLHSQQLGFGCGVTPLLAFERAWDVAGRPALLLRPSAFPADTGGQLLDIHASAMTSASVLATRFRHDDGVTDLEGKPIVSGARKDQALGATVADRVVPDSKPCPFCSRPMVKKDGAFWCVQTLAELSAASAARAT